MDQLELSQILSFNPGVEELGLDAITVFDPQLQIKGSGQETDIVH